MAAREAALVGALAAVASIAPPLAMRAARPPLVLNLGPNDSAYVQGFRADWERDGQTRFRWTTHSAAIRLPVRLQGEGFRLRMRVRRHLPQPAFVRVTVEGRTVDRFEISSQGVTPYRTVDSPVPRLTGGGPFTVMIACESVDTRPLGIAIDWIEIIPERKDSIVHLNRRLSFGIPLLVLLAYATLRLSGSTRLIAGTGAAGLVAVLTWGTSVDPLAADRIVREGAWYFAAVAACSVVLARWPRAGAALGLTTTHERWGLAAAALTSVALRLALVLHPQFFYPDVGIHAVFAGRLAGGGLRSFLEEFTANQFRFSLGLQLENGHWYAFPYPPAFYLVCWPLIRWFGFRPEIAASALPAVVNSLEVWVTFALVRRLGLQGRVALAAAALAHPILPIFMIRLGLAYFPALVGHGVDMVVLLYLIAQQGRLARPKVIVVLASLIALALLSYTQSILNLGLVLPLFLLLDGLRDGTPSARARQKGLLIAGVLGVGLSLIAFYGRYLPVFLDMQRGIPQAEEALLLEKQAKAPPLPEVVAPDEPDPFAGPDLDPGRGLRKAAWRLWVFYGLFAPVLLAGVLASFRDLAPTESRLVAAWAATYVLLNLASGGLPSPNLVRYNKDLELVAPLCCLGLAQVGVWLWGRSRMAAGVYAGGYGAFGLGRAVRALTEKLVLER